MTSRLFAPVACFALIAVVAPLSVDAKRKVRPRPTQVTPAARLAPPHAAAAPTVAPPVAQTAPVAAPAAPPSDDQKKAAAQRLVKEGRGLHDKGQFQSAVEKFEGAYKLFPVPKMLYNIGITYLALHRDDRATCAFERFLEEAPDADPGLRADAREKYQALGPTIGRIAVQAPAGVALFVDGEERTTAPVNRAMCAAPGQRRVVGVAVGTAPVGIGVDVKAGEVATIQLDPATNSASIVGQPPVTSGLPTPKAPGPASQPLIKKWWLWTAIAGGAVVLVGVTVGAAVGSRPAVAVPPSTDFGPFKVFQ